MNITKKMDPSSSSNKSPPINQNDDEDETPSPLTNATTSKDAPQNISTTNLSRTVSMSNISRVSSRIDQTFKQFATRVQVANKLSKAKRKEENMAINAGTLLEEPNCRTKSIKKIQKQLSPFIQQQQQQSKQFYHDQDGNVKECVISGGNLVFDVDYPLSISDSKRSISRPYIYLTADVEMKNITEILFDEWHVSMPRIALFLLSDPDHFRTWNNPRQMASFRTGVMKVSCFCW